MFLNYKYLSVECISLKQVSYYIGWETYNPFCPKDTGHTDDATRHNVSLDLKQTFMTRNRELNNSLSLYLLTLLMLMNMILFVPHDGSGQLDLTFGIWHLTFDIRH